jgi:predicted alpha/beta superfamily hydrolase
MNETLSRIPLVMAVVLSLSSAASAEDALDSRTRSVEQARSLVTFSVQVPPSTPPDAEIWVSGNQPELGNWNGAGVQLFRRASDGRYVRRIPFATGTSLEFKVTRGSWATVEKGPRGEEVANRTLNVLVPTELDISVASWRDQTIPDPQPDTLTGIIRYHDVSGASVGLRDRRLIVYLPPGYDTQVDRRYPVLYMQDGNNLMNARTSFGGVEWGVDETAQRLIQAGQMEPIIIVGVYNTEDRIAEYTPVPMAPYGGGRAEDYGRLLEEVVKPLIDNTYRTKPEPEFTGVAGSSLGGLVSMYFGLTRSDTFRRLGVVSPSVWWANQDIVARVNATPGKLPLRIWVDIGTAEEGFSTGPLQRVVEARLLRDSLVAKGWVLGEDLAYLEVEGGRHNEAAWAARTEFILRYLYPPVP